MNENDKPSHALFRRLLTMNFSLFLIKALTELLNGRPLLESWHIYALARALEDVIAGRTLRLTINLPPQFLKSMICSVALPAFLLGIDPTRKILCISYAQPLAENFHSAFRRIIEAPWYQKTFHPEILRFTLSDLETRQGGRRFATSVGGALTGFSADLIIIDDPLNAGDAHLKSARDQVNNWFVDSAMSRLGNKNTGAIIAVAQRLHSDDLSGFLLLQGGWQHLCLPVIAPCNQTISLPRGKTHLWKQGEPLHPELLSLARIERLKSEIGAYNFSAQYLQEPFQPTGAMLKLEWLRTHDTPPVRGTDDLIVQSWDPAIKPTKSSDYSVCLTFLARKNEIYLLDVFRARLAYPDLVRQVLNQANEYQPNVILVEDITTGILLIQTLKQDHGLSGVIGWRPEKDKVTRMIMHTHTLEADALFVPKYAAWLDDFRVEFLGFPHVHHDDQIDALSQFYGWYETHRRRTLFSFDFGGDDTCYRDRLGAPSADEMRGILGRSS
jgi:predicted phage terminase large subunit-like protein